MGLEPKSLGALAVGSSGALYIADQASNQIIERLPDGSFRVVAGTGVRGFSGDGGPALAARLNDPTGLAVGNDGTIYFADAGNERVRAISRDGLIKTVAGNGGRAEESVASGRPARSTALCHPDALAFGPRHQLYIANGTCGFIMRLTQKGTLQKIAGKAGSYADSILPAGTLARDATADGPNALAFDRRGDLFIASFTTKQLRMISPSGVMSVIANNFYPQGDGGVVADNHGNVFAMNGQTISSVTSRGLHTLVDLSARKILSGQNKFLPNGLALGGGGTIYADTSKGNGWSGVDALIAINAGHVHLLWMR